MKKNSTQKKNNRQQQSIEKNRNDIIELNCLVLEALPGTLFKLQVVDQQNMYVTATLAGKLRKFRIRVLPGDQVKCEVSPYDLTRGRITWRKR